jgi:hypothetical protein
MSKRIYEAITAVKPKFPKAFAFVYRYLPGAIKIGTDDLLAETLEQAATGLRKDNTPILDYWAYCERTYEQKKMDRCAADQDNAALQTKLDLDTRKMPQSVKDVMKGLFA